MRTSQKNFQKKYGTVGFSELVLSVRTKKRFYLENNHISAARAPVDPRVVALNAHSHGAGGTAVRGGSDRLQGLKILQICSSAREQPAGHPREIRNNHPPSRRCCENTPRGAKMNLLHPDTSPAEFQLSGKLCPIYSDTSLKRLARKSVGRIRCCNVKDGTVVETAQAAPLSTWCIS